MLKADIDGNRQWQDDDVRSIQHERCGPNRMSLQSRDPSARLRIEAELERSAGKVSD